MDHLLKGKHYDTPNTTKIQRARRGDCNWHQRMVLVWAVSSSLNCTLAVVALTGHCQALVLGIGFNHDRHKHHHDLPKVPAENRRQYTLPSRLARQRNTAYRVPGKDSPQDYAYLSRLPYAGILLASSRGRMPTELSYSANLKRNESRQNMKTLHSSGRPALRDNLNTMSALPPVPIVACADAMHGTVVTPPKVGTLSNAPMGFPNTVSYSNKRTDQS